jgi:hypothetical protein
MRTIHSEYSEYQSPKNSQKSKISSRDHSQVMTCDLSVRPWRQVGSTIAEVRFAMRNLKSWMRAESVDTPPVLQMGSSRVERIPKGVAGSAVALGDVGGSRIRKSQSELRQLRVPHILKMLKICQFISIGVPGGTE